MAKMKSVKIDFWQATLQHEVHDLGDVFEGLGTDPPAQEIRQAVYEIRRLTRRGDCFRGEFAKIRQDDIPHAGAPGGIERDLALEEHEGLVEKNFFHYHAGLNVLVWQRQANGSAPGRVAQYLSLCSGQAVALNPVLQLEPMRRLMRGGVRVRMADIRLATPRNPALYEDQPTSGTLMKMLSDTGAYSLSVVARGAPVSLQDPSARYLADRVRGAVAELCQQGDLKRAVLEIEDGDNEPSIVDLIKDAMYALKRVEKPGRYFDAAGMHAALDEAFEEKRAQLDALFGTDGHRLV